MPLDVLAYYLSRFSVIESKVINAIMNKDHNFQVDSFDIANENGKSELKMGLEKSKNFDVSEIEELMKFKRKY